MELFIGGKNMICINLNIPLFVSLLLLFFLSSCDKNQSGNDSRLTDSLAGEGVNASANIPAIEAKPGKLEQALIDAGLVSILDIDTTILVELKYSSEDNFFGIDVYGTLENAYFQKEVAEKLVKAQRFLKEKYPDYNLLVYDGVRPRRVQQILWDTIDVPIKEKSKYVADPRKGSLHNYGAAVDLTIADKDGVPLDMGTPYDFFGILAYPSEEERMLKEGKLTKHQVENRKTLREVMQKAGFSPINSEWWHFNAYSLQTAKDKYSVIE